MGFEWWTLAFIGIQKVFLLEHFFCFFLGGSMGDFSGVMKSGGDLIMGILALEIGIQTHHFVSHRIHVVSDNSPLTKG